MRTDLYQAITRSILAAIEAGARSGKYRMPWHRSSGTSTPLNAVSGRPYRGINTLLLWAAATEAGYPTGKWATYRQWSATGAQVRKGEQATVVLLWKTVGSGATDQDQTDADHERSRQRMLARAFHVFNAAQVDGWTPKQPVLPLAARISAAEEFFAALPAEVSHGSDDAFYDPASDNVFLPSFSAFRSAEAYYSVYAHELTHWTGIKSRLDRDLTGRFGSHAYAMEELVAELGAAFTVGHLGLAATPREDHALYIASWLAALKDDPRAIVTAASRAQAAADYLIALGEPTPPIARPAAPECVA
ncbi:ArdC family protein [Sphingomonas sp.]|uniref:ArdC family protein n=1 Tax=Sphingomonas sp. TaxID=28214 RepID=UPI003CC6B4E5